jgi:ABC-type polysaccharide/polyol phosphate transport system ATPase subunit
MAKIVLEDVCLDYPIFNSGSISLRQKMLHTATGGRLAKAQTKAVIVRALSHVSLHVKEGDRLGVIGHNGAGKTTLLRCLSGVYEPTEGKITREGSVASFIEVSAGLEPELSGYDNIRRLLLLRGAYKSNEIAFLTQSVEDFSGLGDFLKLPVRTYSSGMQMRLIFSAATAVVPEIMIMDEFFSVGDEDFREKADKRLKENIAQASILVFASHSQELLKSMCNRFVELKNGQLKEVTL